MGNGKFDVVFFFFGVSYRKGQRMIGRISIDTENCTYSKPKVLLDCRHSATFTVMITKFTTELTYR